VLLAAAVLHTAVVQLMCC